MIHLSFIFFLVLSFLKLQAAAPSNVRWTDVQRSSTAWAFDLENNGETPLIVISTASNFSVVTSSGSGAVGQQTTTFISLAANTTYYFKVKVSTESDVNYTATISTVTRIETPETFLFEEVSITTITVSISSPTFTNIGVSSTALAIARNGVYDPWITTANKWVSRQDMVTARRSLGGAVIGGKIYTVGGLPGSASNKNEEYDPAANSWSSKAVVPTSRDSLACSAAGGKMYCVGGYSGSSLNTNEEYDPVTNSWSTKANMPTARYDLASAEVGGKIYALAGNGGFRKNEEYDPASDSWSTKTDLITDRQNLAAAAVNGKIYAIAGRRGNNSYVNSNEEYDPAANTWALKTGIPTNRTNLAAAAVGGKIYAIGGLDSLSNYLSVNEEYDTATDSWLSKASMPTVRYGLVCLVVDGKIYCVGGANDSYLATNEQYDPGLVNKYTGLTANTQYSFKAKARNQLTVETAESVTVSTYTLAYAPALSAAPFSDVFPTSFTFTWNANGNPNGTQYLVAVSTTNSFNGTSDQALGWNNFSNLASTTVVSLTPNTTYYARVKARNGGSVETASVQSSTMTLAAAPAVPAAPFSAVFLSSFTAAWSSNGNPGNTEYFVRLSTSSALNGSSDRTEGWAVFSSTGFASLEQFRTYYVGVKARNFRNVETNFTTLGSTQTRPATPVSQAATNVLVSSFTANWLANGNSGEALYELGLSQDDFTSVLQTTSTGNTSFTWTGLGPNALYYIRVRSTSTAWGVTAWVNLPNVTTRAADPGIPDPLFTNMTATSFRANWTASSNPAGTQYFLRVSTSSALNGSSDLTAGWTTAIYADFTELGVNTTYFAQVKARNSASVETNYVLLGSTKTLSTAPIPQSPTNVLVSSFTANWGAGDNPAGTQFEAHASTDSAFSVAAASSTYYTYAIFAGLTSNTLHYSRVRTSNSAWTDLPSTTTLAALPVSQNPSNLTTVSFQANWQANSNPAYTRYEAQLSSNNFTNTVSSTTRNLNAAFSNLTPNVAYQTRVAAINEDNNKTFYVSLPSTVTLANAPAAGASPFSSIALSSFTVSWLTNSNSVSTQFYLQLSTASLFNGSLDRTEGWAVFASTTLVALSTNTQYFARVKARNSDNTETSWTTLGSTATFVETPTILIDEILDEALIISVHAANPGFSNLNVSSSGVNFAKDGNYAGWITNKSTWTSRQAMPSVRQNFGLGVVGGKFYAIGGYNLTSPNYKATNEEYDPAANAWTTKTSMSTGRNQLVAVPVGERIYAIGGRDLSSYYAVNEEYDPVSDTWQSRVSMSGGNRALMAAVAVDGKIYVIGGTSNGSDYLTRNEMYDPTANSWTTKTSLPTARHSLMTAAVNGRIYAIGGYDGVNPLSTNEEYNPASNSWATKTSMTTARYSAGAVTLGGKMYVTAGWDGNFLNQNEVYDPQVDNWISKPQALTSRRNLAVAATGGKIYALGGNSGSIIAANEEYDPGLSQKFSSLTPNTSYSFKAQARNVLMAMTAETVTVSTYTAAKIPAAGSPSFSVFESSIQVNWSANSNPSGTQYFVQLATASNFTGTPSSQGWAVFVSTVFAGLQQNATYYARARARNAYNMETNYFVLGSTRTPLISPLALDATNVTTGTIQANWSNPQAAAGTIYDSQISSNDYTSAITSSTANTYALFTGLSPNILYATRVRSLSQNNISPWTTLVSTYTLQTTPTLSFVSINSSSVSLSVSGISNSTAGSSGVRFYSDVTASYGSWLQANTSTYLNLTANTLYNFKVQARNGNGITTDESATISTNTLMSAPTGIGFSAVNITSMTIYAQGTFPNLTQGASGVNFSSTSGTGYAGWTQTNSQTFTGLSPNTAYGLKAKARNQGALETSESALVTKYALARPPTSSVFTEVFGSSLTLSWNANGNPAGTRFEISFSTDNFVNHSSSPVTLANNLTSTTVTLRTLRGRTTYYMKIRAANNEDVFTSYDTTLTTWTLPSPPPPPEGLTLGYPDSSSTDRLSVAWSHDLYNVNSFRAERSLNNSVWSVAFAVNAPTLSGLDTGLAANTRYYYRVVAMNDDGETISLSSSIATRARVPSISSVDGDWSESLGYYLRPAINENSNPSTTLYAIYNTDSGSYLDGNGAGQLGATPVWKTKAQWETGDVNTHSLGQAHANANQTKSYKVIAANLDYVSVDLNSVSSASGTTPLSPPSTVAAAEINDDLLRVSWSAVDTVANYSLYYATYTAATPGQTIFISSLSAATLSYDDDINGANPTQVQNATTTVILNTKVSLAWAAPAVTAASAARYYRARAINSLGKAGGFSANAVGASQVTPEISYYSIARGGVFLSTTSALSYEDKSVDTDTEIFNYALTARSSDDLDSPSTTVAVVRKSTPSIPTVSDDGDFTPSVTQLKAAWSSIFERGTLAEYFYGIGTTSASANVVGWTSVQTSTWSLISNLTLNHGATYYLFAKAKSSLGFYSEAGVADGIVTDIILPKFKDTLLASVQGNTVLILWNPPNVGPSRVKKYKIEERNILSPTWRLLVEKSTSSIQAMEMTPLRSLMAVTGNMADLSLETQQVNISNISDGTYFYRVFALNGAGVLSEATSETRVVVGLGNQAETLANPHVYPNPVDSRSQNATILYSLNQNSDVEIKIYDLFGKEVNTLNFAAGGNGGRLGGNETVWDAVDFNGRKISTGVYVMRIRVANDGTVKVIRAGVVH